MADPIDRGGFMEVLDNYHAVGADDSIVPQRGQHLFRFLCPVRRVEEDDVVGRLVMLFQEARHRNEPDLGQALKPAPLEIGSQQPAHSRTGLHERCLLGPSTQGLDPDVAGSCVEVEETRAGNPAGENVEEGLFDLVRCGTDGQASRPGQPASARCAADDSHGHTSLTWPSSFETPENQLDKVEKIALWGREGGEHAPQSCDRTGTESETGNYRERVSAVLTAGCFFWLWVMVESTIAPQLMHFQA